MRTAGIHTESLPVLADGQQAALQLDAFGRLVVTAGSGSPGAAGGAVQSVQGVPGGLPLPMIAAAPATSPFVALPVAVAAAGDGVLVAGLPGQTIRVFAVALTCAAPVDLTLKDGSGVLAAFRSVTALQLEPLAGHPRWVGTPGAALGLHLSAAVAVGGAVWFVQA